MNIYTELIADQGLMTFSIEGNSMEPLFKKGDFIRICKVMSLKPGDCYLFKHKGKLILHRLAGIKGEDYYFIGDNSNGFEKVTRKQICGVLYGSSQNNMAKQMIRIINQIYQLTLKWKPHHYITGFRKRIIRTIIQEFS